MISHNEQIGARIKDRRKALGLSQEELARTIGTNQKQVSRYETGENDPTANVLIELTYALDASADWLLGLTKNTKRIDADAAELKEIEREAIQILRNYTPDQQRKLVDFMYLARRFVLSSEEADPSQLGIASPDQTDQD